MKIIIQLFVLFILSCNAYSASSWVLWAEVGSVWEPNEAAKRWDKHSINWKLLNAFNDKKSCQSGLNDAIKKITAPDKNEQYDVLYKVNDNEVTLFYFPNNAKGTDVIQRSETYRYICIPDSIDPRN